MSEASATISAVDRSAAAEELHGASRPADVAAAAGAWLAAELADAGFTWSRSQRELKRRAGHRTDLIAFQASTWNRTGGFVRLDARLTAYDRGVAAWRRAHPDLVAAPELASGRIAGILFGTLLGSHIAGGVVLTDATHREQALARFAADIRTVALPWFDAVATASDFDAIPRATLDGAAVDLVELLVSRGEPAKARTLIGHWLSLGDHRPEAYQQGRELAEQGVRPGATRRAHLLGWSATVLGLDPTV